jgi:hypothetical protein
MRPRPVFVDRQLEIGVGLVILESDVIVRAMLFDQDALQENGLLLGNRVT